MKNSRLSELDALRGIAVVIVLIYHYVFRYDSLYTHQFDVPDWMHFFKYGVELFFMISGFVIYWTLNRIKKPLDFLVSRVSRLYPVYWVAVIITFLLVSYLGLPDREVSLTIALSNFLMFHEYLKVPHVDGAYWSLTVELTFYFWVFILYLFNQFKRVEFWLSAFLLLAFLQGSGLIALPSVINKIFFLEYISFFIAGICFFKIQDGQSNKMTVFILALSLVVTIFTFSPKHFVLFTVFYLIFYFSVFGYMKFLVAKPFLFFGKISYPLYLLHQNIGYALIYKCYYFGVSPWISIPMAFLLTIIVSYLLSVFVEKPVLLIFREKYNNNSSIQSFAERLKPSWMQ